MTTPRLSRYEWGWLGPIGIALVAFGLRLPRLGTPNAFIFDETYYAKDAWGLLQWGYSRDGVEGANELILQGRTDAFTQEPTWIVHPNGGKWLIAIGEHFFGLTPYGWRIAAVVVGSLMVLVLGRLVLRLTGSVVIACIGAALLALDGNHFTLSRIALLDIFLAFWILCAVACLAADRDWIGRKLQESDRYRYWRPWQLAAGICFGLAVGTKWSGLYVLAAFGVTVVVWELWLRGRPASWKDAGRRLLLVGLPAFGWLVVVGFVVYLITWTGFLVHHQAYEARFGHGYGDIPRWGDYVDNPTGGPFGGLIDGLRSLWHFHVMTYDFHTGDYMATKTHPWQSNPLGWLVQRRPTLVYSEFGLPVEQCGAPAGSQCARVILVLGNPAVWWVGTAALVAAVVAFARRPSWRWSIVLVGVASTWLPWFTVGNRPIFTWYAVAIGPFVIIAICMVLAALKRRLPERIWWIGVSIYLGFVVLLFWYFYPIWSASLMTYDSWFHRMWFDRWR